MDHNKAHSIIDMAADLSSIHETIMLQLFEESLTSDDTAKDIIQRLISRYRDALWLVGEKFGIEQ